MLAELNNIIADVTKESHFQNDLYRVKLSNIITSIKEKDSFILVGPCISGKSIAFDIISEISQRLHRIDPYVNPLVHHVKIFPKAIEPTFLFSENDKKTALQFYSN